MQLKVFSLTDMHGHAALIMAGAAFNNVSAAIPKWKSSVIVGPECVYVLECRHYKVAT